MIDYQIRHETTHKDVRGEWRAITYVTVADCNIRVLTTKRPSDQVLAALVRVTRGGKEFDGRKDFYKELSRVPGSNQHITRDECNAVHFVAVRGIADLVAEVARHYGL